MVPIQDIKPSIVIAPNLCIRKITRPSRSKKKQSNSSSAVDKSATTSSGPSAAPFDNGLRSYFQLLEEREENARKIWSRIHMDVSKRRSGKIRTHFPVMRIKTIMKLDPDVGPVSRDAAAAISFTAELFIHELASLAWIETEKRCATVMTRPDIFQAVRCFDHFDFLADVLPFWRYAAPSRRGPKGKAARESTGGGNPQQPRKTTKPNKPAPNTMLLPGTGLGRLVGPSTMTNYSTGILVYPANC